LTFFLFLSCHSGSPLHISHVVVDTVHFKGNFPQYCEVHAISSPSVIPPHSPFHAPPPTSFPTSEAEAPVSETDEWTLILPRTNLGPHREHFLAVEDAEAKAFTHVRLTIYPDGGVKRVRVFGSKEPSVIVAIDGRATGVAETATIHTDSNFSPLSKSVIALPVTPEAFAPFGQVIQSYPDVHAAPAPRSTKITPANFGTALKYHKLALLASSYPDGVGATPGISVYRCEPAPNSKAVEVKVLERHPHTNQAFIPLGADAQKKYVVAVAQDGEGGKPDMRSLRAFVVRGDQGIVYNTAVWRAYLSFRRSTWI
jgi:allantoicase